MPGKSNVAVSPSYVDHSFQILDFFISTEWLWRPRTEKGAMVEGKVILRRDCMVEYECYKNMGGNTSGGNVYVGWGLGGC